MTRNKHDRLNDHFGQDAAANVDYDNAVSGLTATDVQDAIDEVAAATAGTLTVKEVDGTPTVSPVTTIRVSNGTLTDDGSGQVSITTGGGGGGGGGWQTLSTYGTQLETGRSILYDENGLAQIVLGGDIGLYAAAGGRVDIYADDSQFGLYFDSGLGTVGRAVFDQGDGVAFPEATADPSTGQQGLLYYNTTYHQFRVFRANTPASPDVGKWFALEGISWAPQAFPVGFVNNATYTTAVNLAVGAVAAIPFVIPSWMRVAAVRLWNTDTTLAREFEVAIYVDNFVNSAVQVADSHDFAATWTAAAAAQRTMSYATSTRPFLPPGIAWVLIRNSHASNTLGIGTAAASSQTPTTNFWQTKSSVTLGSSVDLVLATWTKQTSIPCVSLVGSVLGQTTSF